MYMALLCSRCQQSQLPPAELKAAPGTCTECRKPHATKPFFNLCPGCSIDPAAPKCEKCGVALANLVANVSVVNDAGAVSTLSTATTGLAQLLAGAASKVKPALVKAKATVQPILAQAGEAVSALIGEAQTRVNSMLGGAQDTLADAHEQLKQAWKDVLVEVTLVCYLRLADSSVDLTTAVPGLKILVQDGDLYVVEVPKDSLDALKALDAAGKVPDPTPEQVTRLNELLKATKQAKPD